MFSAVKSWFSSGAEQLAAHAQYAEIVALSRNPVFYAEWGVPDTLDGRFDMIALHLCIVLERLEREEESRAQALLEAFFADMDRSLREMGVSDTGVGIRVKKMAQAFYGRKKAYGEAKDIPSLEAALRRNIWREMPVDAAHLRALADYAQQQRTIAPSV